MSTATTSNPRPPLSYSPRPRSRGRGFNWRLPLFIAVIAVPILTILYIFVTDSFSHGITNRGSYLEVELRHLGNFPFSQADGSVNDVPAEFRALDGKKVMLQGHMYSPQNAGGRGVEFQFVYDVTKCCFRGPPQVQERVYGHVRDGSEVQIYTTEPLVRLVGTLHVRVIKDDSGAIHSVYDIDVDEATPVS